MTREEFATLEAGAIEQLERIRLAANAADIVMVVSRDVLAAMREIDITATHNETTQRPDGLIAAYQGYQIAVVNDHETLGMMRPALRSMEYHDWMRIDDIIIVDEENRLFRLANIEPYPLFVDMGLTVSYFTGFNVEAETVRVRDGVGITVDRTLYMTDTNGNTFEMPGVIDIAVNTTPETVWRPITNLNPMGTVTFTGTLTDEYDPIATALNANIADTMGYRPAVSATPTKRSHKKKKEEELNAGDTKLIDEFLNGFAHKGGLK